MAGPLRGGGGVKGWPLRKSCCHLKIKIILLHITLKFVSRYLSGLLQYFPKNRAILVQKLEAEKELTNSVSVYFVTKKRPLSASGGGGVRLKRRTFFLWLP